MPKFDTSESSTSTHVCLCGGFSHVPLRPSGRHSGSFHTRVTLKPHSGTATPLSPKARPFPARTETFVHVSPGLKKQKNAGSGKDISFFRRNSSAGLPGSLDRRLPVPHGLLRAERQLHVHSLEYLMAPDHLMDQVEALAVTFAYVLHFHWINLITISKKLRWSLAVDIDR